MIKRIMIALSLLLVLNSQTIAQDWDTRVKNRGNAETITVTNTTAMTERRMSCRRVGGNR